ncbi:MAG: FAD-binding oxidoreductase, partial [Acidobacteria bacterium]
MQIKTNRDEFENYLRDASNIIGHAEKVFIPETVKEVSEILSEANARKIPITIAGARTGTVGGAVPFGGYVISLEKFDKVLDLDKTRKVARVQAGVLLRDFQKLVDAEKLFYPPDPTEWSCQIGGNIATNASGARSFKYGSTRNYVQSIKVALANGDVFHLRRGEVLSSDGSIEIEVNQGNKIRAKLPTYPQPRVRKNTSGYFTASRVDAVDLFIGSEGTLGVVLEAELKLLDKPESFFSGIVFFENESDLLACVSEARKRSFDSRNSMILDINATLLEYFDHQSLKFISRKFPEIPNNANSALFFEQETNEKTEDYL